MKKSARSASAGKKRAVVKKAISKKPRAKSAPRKSIFSSKTQKDNEIINVRSIAKAGRLAASKAMKTMGYVIVSEGDWVVKKFVSGRTRKIEKIAGKGSAQKFTLD